MNKFVRCGGQVHSYSCQLLSGFCMPKIIKNWLVFERVIKKLKCGRFFVAQCMLLNIVSVVIVVHSMQRD